MRLRLRLVPALVTVMLLVGTVAGAPAGAQPPPPPPAVSCQVSYQVDAAWAAGFAATAVVTNTGGVPVTWRVTIVFPDGGISYGWNGILIIGRGTVIIEPPTWSPVLHPGQSLAAGLVGTGTGVPTSVQVTCHPA